MDQIGYVSPGLTKGNCMVAGLEAERASNTLSTFPNPFHHTFVMYYQGSFHYQLLNVEGHEVASGADHGGTEIGEGLPSGVYVLKVLPEDGALRILKMVKSNH